VSVVVALHSIQFLVRSRASLHLEIVSRRHQLAVVNRSPRQRLRLPVQIERYGRGLHHHYLLEPVAA